MCIKLRRQEITSEILPQTENYFFLCLFFLRRFLRLCVAILCFFLFFPLGIVMLICSSFLYYQGSNLKFKEGLVKQLF